MRTWLVGESNGDRKHHLKDVYHGEKQKIIGGKLWRKQEMEKTSWRKSLLKCINT